MALRLRIRTVLIIAALAAAAGAALGATTAATSHVTTTAGGMGPHGVITFQPDPVIIIDR